MDGTTIEECSECGFRSADWTLRDAHTLFDALGYWWRLAIAGVDSADLNRRPSPSVWSPLEYGVHTAKVTRTIRRGVEQILAEDGCTLGPVPEAPGAAAGDVVARLDPVAVLDRLEGEGATLALLARSSSAPWGNIGHAPDRPIEARTAVLHAAHDVSHHFMDVARGLAELGVGVPPGAGAVVQINVSDGGVPKSAVAGGRIGWRGLDADRQADRTHHGRPFQALCLWSAEVIAELAAAGHPIAPGCAGENLTVSGLDWSSMRPGALLAVGSALLEISYPAVPCTKQAQWFGDGDYSRLSHESHPEWARWYAWVRQPGEVAAGDGVAVQRR
jgi:MOSC domain-containing protein YiiM